MKSYGYKLINYVFSIAVYDLLLPLYQFFDAVTPKIPGSGIEEFVEPVFKILFFVKVIRLIWFDKERKSSNPWVQGSENTMDAE